MVAKAGARRCVRLLDRGHRLPVDLAARPELARIHERSRSGATATSRRPARRTWPAASSVSRGGLRVLAARGAGAEYLRNIHCFNLGAALSFGIPVGDVPSMVVSPTARRGRRSGSVSGERRRRGTRALHQRAARAAGSGALSTRRRGARARGGVAARVLRLNAARTRAGVSAPSSHLGSRRVRGGISHGNGARSRGSIVIQVLGGPLVPECLAVAHR